MNNKLKVLIIADGIGPHAGRGTDVIEEIIREESQNGIQITLLTTIDRFTTVSEMSAWKSRMSELGIRVETVSLTKFARWPHLSIWLSKPVTMIAAIRLLRSTRFTVIHEYSSSPLLCLRTCVLGAIGGCKTFHTVITANTTIMSAPITGLFCRVVTKVIFPSMQYAQKFSKFLSMDNVVILSQGVDTKRFSPAARTGKLPFKTAKGRLLVYLGPPEESKGIFVLANAYKKVTRHHPDVTLLFVFYRKISSREYRRSIYKLRKVLKGVSRWSIHETLVDVPTLFSRSSFVVVPQSTPHGTLIHPQTLLEAMSCGRAIIAPRDAVLAEFVQSGENGYLFESSDPKSLADRLEEAFAADSQETGKKARRTIENGFDLRKNTLKLIEFYKTSQ